MQLTAVRRAAVALFAVKGFSATGIRELGRESGLNSATLYHYVGSKEDLLVEIIRDCLQSMTDTAAGAMRASADPLRQLAGLVISHVGITALNPLTCRVAEYEMRALSPGNAEQLQKMRDDYEAMFAEVIERGTRTGRFQVADLSLSRLALLEMCTGVAHWYRPEGRVGLEELQRYWVGLACRLVSADADELLDDLPQVAIPRLESEPLRPGMLASG